MSLIKTLLILSIVLFPLIKSETEPISIPIKYSSTFTLSESNSFNKYFVINYSESDISSANYLIISANTKSYSLPGFIYFSFSEKNPSSEKRDYLSQHLGKNEIIINTQKLKSFSNIYINIHSLTETEIDFNVVIASEIYISNPNSEGDPSNNKIRFKISDVKTVKMSFDNSEKNYYNKIMFYSVGDSINYFNMKISYNDGTSTKDFTTLQKFENGYGALIDLNDEINNGVFSLEFENTDEKYKEKEIEVGVELAEQSNETLREMNVMEHVYGYINNLENCYKIKNLNEAKINENLVLLLNIYSQSMSFAIYNTLKEKQYSLDIFNNYYIKLPVKKFMGNYFCFKKYTPKYKEVEELGEISYDIQTYYENDLTSMQPYFYPLINGKIYTHSIKSGQIMLFRHLDYTNHNMVYSAVMTQLRGNPVLYGYNCDSFPECNLDIYKFNQLKESGKIDLIEKINRYYINNKGLAENSENILSNSAYDKNQYLSIVVCDTDSEMPNGGECQFTIELNDFTDEIQLINDQVYANSLISYDQNYFRIKLNNYQDILYLQINFTVFTGSAEMEIYSDKEHKNKITNYFYNSVHRKEYFLFDAKNSQILENYYIKIISKDSAFIELKYGTDLDYKGYIMTNPNEMNILMVNKEQYYDTFEVLNTHYFYPELHPRNTNFSFFINSLDCGLLYRYNFWDHHNITTFDQDYYTTNKFFFTTSYAFMLKVDDYYHTVKDEQEFCAVMLYEIEKNENYPVLISEDMFHPSKFQNTYYQYPFLMNDDLNGILIQFKFDYDNFVYLNIDNKPKVEIIFKFPNQKQNFETHVITKDSSFFIPKKNFEEYCPNFYQCSLKINILKQEDYAEDGFYSIYTNIHSSFNSLEYITKNKIFNYNLRPNDKRYFYTQIDKGEQGEINFLFNKGNGKIYATLLEKSGDKSDKIPNFDEFLPYDYLNNVVKYDAKDKNNCEKGCLLYFLIENAENSQNYLTEVSFNINKKWQENNNENGIIEIPLNKYIKGTLKKNDYKYYTITVPYDYRKIAFNLYSKKGIAYIIEGKSHFSKKDYYNWELKPDNSGFGRTIILSNSLSDVSFSIGITSDNDYTIGDEEEIIYYLEIQGLYNDDIDNPFYHITNERSITCNTRNSFFCNAILYIDNNHNNKKSLISALATLGSEVMIYANIIKANEFEEISYDKSIDNYFPTKDNYQQKSEKKNYIFININNSDNDNDNNDVYILLTIYSTDLNDRIKIISNGFDVNKILLPYNIEKLIDFNQDIEFIFPSDSEDSKNYDYIVNIKNIKGNQNIVLNGEQKIENINGNYYFSANYKDSLYIKSNTNENQGFIISIQLKVDNNCLSLEKNIENEITLLSESFANKFLPQNTFIEITSPLKVEIYFHDIVYNSLQNKDNDKFKISAKIKNSKDVIFKEINSNYLFYEKTAIIKVNEEDINTDDVYYLYINVEKDSQNKNIYKEMKIQYISNELKGMEIIPNKYYYSYLNTKEKKEVYLMNKMEESDKYLVIDFSESIPVINDFNIEKEFINSINKISDDEIKEIDFHGRKRFIVELNSNQGIKLNINKTSDDNNDKYYMLNYYSVNDLSKIENYNNFNDSLYISKNEKDKSKTNLKFNNIMVYKKSIGVNIKSLVYYIDIFKKNEDIKEINNIYSIYLGNHDDKNINKYTIIDNNSYDLSKEKVELTLDINKDNLKNNDYIIRVLADIENNDNSKEKFVFNANLVDTDEPYEDTTDDRHEDTTDHTTDSETIDGTAAVIVCSVYMVVVLLVVGLIVLLCIKMKKNIIGNNSTIRTERQTANDDSLLP